MKDATKPLQHERIIQDPQVMVGKPVIKGTRIPVERVLAHLAQNPALPDLFAAYPELTEEDVKASLDYAREAIARTYGPKDTSGDRSSASV